MKWIITVRMDSWVRSALKSILRGTLFLILLLSSNSFLHPFLKSKFTKKKFLDTKKIHFRRPTAWELIKNKGSDFGFWRTKENFFNLNQFVDVGDKFSRLASPKWLLKLFYIEHEWLRHIFINKIYNFILMMILIRKVIS